MNEYTWIYILVGIVVGVLCFFVMKNLKTKPSQVKKSHVDLSALFDALGGKENLVSSTPNGSKVVFVLKNPKAISSEGLKALGASGIVASKEHVTVIFGKASEALVKEIEQVL